MRDEKEQVLGTILIITAHHFQLLKHWKPEGKCMSDLSPIILLQKILKILKVWHLETHFVCRFEGGGRVIKKTSNDATSWQNQFKVAPNLYYPDPPILPIFIIGFVNKDRLTVEPFTNNFFYNTLLMSNSLILSSLNHSILSHCTIIQIICIMVWNIFWRLAFITWFYIFIVSFNVLLR